MVTNAGLVAGLLIGLAFLLAGVLLLRRGSLAGGAMVTLGGGLILCSHVYGLVVLRPFIGRTFDQMWYRQIATVEGLTAIGMLICASGVVAHALALKKDV